MSRTFRWGIMGCGGISNDFTLALRSVPGASVAAVSTANSLPRANEFAAKHGVKTSYGNYDSLLADKNVDIVYVGTYNTTHYDLVLKSLQAGKHVVCEKPMGVNSRQVKAMVATARQNKRFLMEAMWTRFFPAMRQCRQLIYDGAIGEVRKVDADFGVPIPVSTDRVWKLESAGGALLDLGVYPLYFTSMCFADYRNSISLPSKPFVPTPKRPINVSACGKLNSAGIDKWSAAVLDYSADKEAENNEAAGKHGIVSCAMNVRTCESWVVAGSKGVIRIHGPSHTPTVLSVTRYGDDSRAEHKTETLSFDPELPMLSSPPTPIKYVYPGSEGLAFQALAAQDAIAEGQLECPEMSLNESIMLAEVMDDIRRQVGVRYPQDSASKL